MVSTVDYMIAAGTSIGVISVFLVPKVSPSDIPDIFKTDGKKQVNKHCVSKLFSLIGADFYKHFSYFLNRF